jgi:hypothetical protein
VTSAVTHTSAFHAQPGQRWFRLSEQNLRIDKWSVCQG